MRYRVRNKINYGNIIKDDIKIKYGGNKYKISKNKNKINKTNLLENKNFRNNQNYIKIKQYKSYMTLIKSSIFFSIIFIIGLIYIFLMDSVNKDKNFLLLYVLVFFSWSATIIFKTNFMNYKMKKSIFYIKEHYFKKHFINIIDKK